MRRKIYQNLLDWKNKESRKPLIVFGARQVGKTYTITEFCNNEYNDVIIINLLEDDRIVKLFDEKISSEKMFITLKSIIGTEIDIESPNTIIFFDEVQESEELISSLKFFNEQYPHINIICAGSLLGVKLRRFSASFPVGKVQMLDMFPMSFEEFMWANKQELLLEEIKKSYINNKPLVSALHDTAMSFFRYYLCIGGMPEVVNNYVLSGKDVTKTDLSLLEEIIRAYFQDMNKYVINKNEAIKIERLYNSLPAQLSNESKKFQFGKINSNARRRDYKTAQDWLLASRLILESKKVSVPIVPLKGYIQEDFFKLFLSDVGILRSLLEIKLSDILLDNIGIYKGPMIENYVANEFTINNISLYYWYEKSIGEIDFLLYTNDGIIPVEVKAGDSVRSKSLVTYTEKFEPKFSIRISSKNFGFVNGIKSVPLYSVFCITDN